MNTLPLVLWNVEYMAAGAIPIGEHFYFFFFHLNDDTSLFCYLENALDEITLMF
jgi:hypothetical protein